MENSIKYDVRNNTNNKISKSFSNLEDAINYCNSKTNKFGCRVTSTENGRLVVHYDTFKNTNERNTWEKVWGK